MKWQKNYPAFCQQYYARARVEKTEKYEKPAER
jgi:hypothetical protein